ncbi:MAG: ATP-binding cassette domain-containing protein [Myxococcota bacterium]
MKLASAPPLLEVENLSVRARGHQAVDSVTFSANAGEITAVIGPNGAGKTSLLEALVGVIATSSGQVRAGGKPLTSFSERARSFAFLPDNAELPAETSVGTLVKHALAQARPNHLAIEELRRLLAIDLLLERGAGVLSRGERQRVALFCTLALGRPIVVLDEPFSAFDPLQLQKVLSAVRSIANAGTAVVASIHQLGDAEMIADRALLMAEGRAVAFDTLPNLKLEAQHAERSLKEAFVRLLAWRARGA